MALILLSFIDSMIAAAVMTGCSLGCFLTWLQWVSGDVCGDCLVQHAVHLVNWLLRSSNTVVSSVLCYSLH